MKKRFLGVSLLALVAVVGLASCDDKKAELVDANGETYTVKTTKDGQEVLKVVTSLASIQNDDPFERIAVDADIDADIVGKYSNGTIYESYDIDMDAYAQLSFNEAKFSSISPYGLTSSEYIEKFHEQFAYLTGYLSVDGNVNYKNETEEKAVDLDVTLYKNTYKDIEGIYAHLENVDIKGLSSDEQKKYNAIKTLIGANEDFYLDSKEIFKDAITCYILASLFGQAEGTVPTVGRIVSLTELEASDASELDNVSISSVGKNTVTITVTDESTNLFGYNAMLDVDIKVNTKTGLIEEVDLDADNFSDPKNTAITFGKSDFSIDLDLSYNDDVKIKSVAKANYFDASAMIPLLVSLA